MNANYIYKSEDGVFNIGGADGSHVAAFEQCYPFDLGGRRFAYRATEQDFFAAREHLFGTRYGGFDPTDKHQAELNMAIMVLSTLLDDQFVYMTARAASLLTFGRYPRMMMVAGEHPGPQRLGWISPPDNEAAILYFLFDSHSSDVDIVASGVDMPLSEAVSALQSLGEKGYVLQKCNGEYALTKAGFFLVCEMARLSPDPLDDAREDLGWDSAEERLVGISGFEKGYFFLSNFFEAPVCYDAIHYLNSEAVYQSWRCANREERDKFSCLFAADAKKMGHHGIETRSDWDDVKFRVMREVLRAKFEQNPSLAERLASTYGHLCETNNWHDNVYGDCVCPDCQGTPGQNMLGSLLMDERAFWRARFKHQPATHAPQEHEYRLYQEPFQKILSGEKDIELRLWDEKRRRLRIGDTVKFLGPENGQWIVVEVQSLAVFPDFEYLFREVDPKRCGSGSADAKTLAIQMRSYYSEEELDRHNVVAIGIRVIETYKFGQMPTAEEANNDE